MAVPSRWKIKRELRRIKGQIAQATAKLYEPGLDKWHLREFDSRVVTYSGSGDIGKKVAVFVIFQPPGIDDSTYHTCRFLRKNGYSPVVVSNAPLSEDDRSKLLRETSMVVQRPNHGYDFGAYRDGLRLLDRSGHTPETLILMNDSTWFPLHAEDRSLAELDRADAPFSGLSYKYEPPIRRGRSHMESHFLRFSATTLKSPAFREFWSAYIPSNSRVTTIERGEKGLTSAIEAAGLPAVSILSRERLLYALAGVPPARLEELLWSADITAVPDRERLADHLADFHDDVGWASDAVRLMEDLTDRFSTVLSAELVALTAVCLGLPFLKKSRESRFARARRMYLDLVADGRVPPADPQILEEIRRAAAQDAATDPTKPV